MGNDELNKELFKLLQKHQIMVKTWSNRSSHTFQGAGVTSVNEYFEKQFGSMHTPANNIARSLGKVQKHMLIKSLVQKCS